jgi:hypothetical protein
VPVPGGGDLENELVAKKKIISTGRERNLII